MAIPLSANWDVVSLTGTNSLYDLGNGITASTIHQIYCLSAGVITITPMKGSTFIWSGTTNSSIDVLPRQTIVSSGTFIGFRAKFSSTQFYS
jgi:hypothetical protein